MILTTTENIPGREYEIVGVVRGGTVQTKNLGKDILSGLKGLVGGEITAYSDMMNEARAIATKRMVEDAESQGADAIVCMRYASASVMQSAAEVIAYGTAVKLK
ncbi:MAG TPA: heavy metal-binding domain-containing protein [Candidatus Acidoferrum sp.]|nr:heavy metal-binding domain-containing protein [Candidatus Acidoferrum sp.]